MQSKQISTRWFLQRNSPDKLGSHLLCMCFPVDLNCAFGLSLTGMDLPPVPAGTHAPHIPHAPTHSRPGAKNAQRSLSNSPSRSLDGGSGVMPAPAKATRLVTGSYRFAPTTDSPSNSNPSLLPPQPSNIPRPQRSFGSAPSNDLHHLHHHQQPQQKGSSNSGLRSGGSVSFGRVGGQATPSGGGRGARGSLSTPCTGQTREAATPFGLKTREIATTPFTSQSREAATPFGGQARENATPSGGLKTREFATPFGGQSRVNASPLGGHTTAVSFGWGGTVSEDLEAGDMEVDLVLRKTASTAECKAATGGGGGGGVGGVGGGTAKGGGMRSVLAEVQLNRGGDLLPRPATIAKPTKQDVTAVGTEGEARGKENRAGEWRLTV